MTTISQFATTCLRDAVANRSKLPKQNITAPRAETGSPAKGHEKIAPLSTRVVWPIFVIGLGAMLTLLWMIFLVWEIAVGIVAAAA
jgi:hypothetical protein